MLKKRILRYREGFQDIEGDFRVMKKRIQDFRGFYDIEKKASRTSKKDFRVLKKRILGH